MSIPTISREALKHKMDLGERFVLADVLEPETYQSQHLPGAINLPWNRVAELAPAVLPDRTAVVIVYCEKPS